MSEAGRKIVERIKALAKFTDEPGKITRLCASPAMRRANELVAEWMGEAGMKTRVDAVGNLIGHYAAGTSDAKVLLLGSHLDTVRDAGKFDGPLGVLLAIACVEHLRQMEMRLPFALEVVGFADEEGVRFQIACLGSKALAGSIEEKDLERKDDAGITLREALRIFGAKPENIKSARMNPDHLLGYLEAHIEQGPTLEEVNLAVGIVTAITGQTRTHLTYVGRAGHVGTTPMHLRKDALCAAAEFILAVESYAKTARGLVATVGEIAAFPGASNVIPGEVQLTLDVRHAKDAARKTAHAELQKIARDMAAARKIKLKIEVVHETAAVNCSETYSSLLGEAVLRRQGKWIRLPSGAGHDAAVMAEITPSAMLFIRCKNGLSHHPNESVKMEDVEVALEVMNDFIHSLAQEQEKPGGKRVANPPLPAAA